MLTMSELLVTKDKWTRGKNGRNKDYEDISEKSPECVCRCLYGTIHAAYPDGNEAFDVIEEIRNVVEKYFGTNYAAATFNDEMARFQDVKALVNFYDGLISEEDMVEIFSTNKHFQGEKS